MVTPLQFFLVYTTFLLVIIQLGAMAGASVVSGEIEVTPPSPPTDVLSAISWFFGNIVFFFQLMTISTDWLLFGVIILTPFIIGLIWILVQLIASIISGILPT